MAIKKGQKAPTFSLYNTDKELVSSEDFAGKPYVLLFFPLAFTGVCTNELCRMRDHLSFYNEMDANVVAISVDSPFTLEKFKEAQSYNFPLLSDFNKEVSRSYESLYEDFAMGMKGVSKRSAFVIDKNGIIQYAEVLEDAGQEPNYQAIDEVVRKLSAS